MTRNTVIKEIIDCIDWNTKPEWATGVATNMHDPHAIYWVSDAYFSEFMVPNGQTIDIPNPYSLNTTSSRHIQRFKIIRHLVNNPAPIPSTQSSASVEKPKYSAYHRLIQSQHEPVYGADGKFLGLMVDAYDVFEAFDPEDRIEAETHALKKLLVPGKRGAKTIIQDIKESIWSLKLALVKRIHREAKNKYFKK
jgi:hypothetical protein